VDKTAIKNFSIWARKKSIADVSNKAAYFGITAKEIKSPLPQSTPDLQFINIGAPTPTKVTGKEIEQRKALVARIKAKEASSDYKTAYNSVMEEVAYTWFNRLIAIRFMEVNDYLPSHTRVLSSEDKKKLEPDFVTNPFDTDLEFSKEEQNLIHKYKEENKLGMLFRMLFIKQCNKLNEILPELFEKTNDYSELLLNISFTDQEGLVYHLTHDISENDFNVEKEGQIEIIGWIYQFYNEERRNEVINIYKGTVKKEDIPVATQIFTTDWVVGYMVDNSLGRYWIERNPESRLKEKLNFFVTPKDGQMQIINEKIQLKDLTFFDPCMGSGHILIYAFDVLMEIYKESGFSPKDAAPRILADNIYGLDIDDRAYQLAYFAVMMKARSYNRNIFALKIEPNVSAVYESNGIASFRCSDIKIVEKQNEIAEYLIHQFLNAKEIGSLQTIAEKDYQSFKEYLQGLNYSGQASIFSSAWLNETLPVINKLLKQAMILSRKYSAVVTNPPYLNKFEANLKDFVISRYKQYSGDLFSVFMYRNFEFCKPDGYSAFMTPFVWMFIKTYENLRKYIIEQKSIVSLIQMEYSAFEEATVPICTFVLKNRKTDENGFYFKLSEFKGGMEVQKKKVLEAIENKNCGYYFETSAENFSKIPGSPVAYWMSEKAFNLCKREQIFENFAKTRAGMITGDNNLFIRLWHEVSREKIGIRIPNREEAIYSKNKWFPYNKGGNFRKWYGNNEYVVNWENDGSYMRKHKDLSGKIPAHAFNLPYIFKKNVTWNSLSSYKFTARYTDKGFLFDASGSFADVNTENLSYTLAFLCSGVAFYFLSAMNPTLNFQKGNISGLPFILIDDKREIDELVRNSILLSRTDWDSFETSWDFKTHPFIVHKNNGSIESSFKNWEEFAERQFYQLKANEEELNRIFIDIYGLQDELTPDVEEKDVTVRKANLGRDIRSFISYAVGCMLGRYSLDVEGLAYAGGDWDESKYKTYIPDADNCIPITDEEYFDDDIVSRFVDFVKAIYGKDTLENNLEFIAEALGNRGDTPLKTIRNYFINEFYKDHVKIYQKRPIYWLFESGKENGFKALIYMHRYNVDTIGNMRIEYIHKLQAKYESQLSFEQHMIDTSQNQREKTAAMKQKEKLIRQIKEIKDYDVKIAHLANCRIEIDLDDGVKVNYEKVQTGKDGKMLEVLAKI
jgi:hypothetical protein